MAIGGFSFPLGKIRSFNYLTTISLEVAVVVARTDDNYNYNYNYDYDYDDEAKMTAATMKTTTKLLKLSHRLSKVPDGFMWNNKRKDYE